MLPWRPPSPQSGAAAPPLDCPQQFSVSPCLRCSSSRQSEGPLVQQYGCLELPLPSLYPLPLLSLSSIEPQAPPHDYLLLISQSMRLASGPWSPFEAPPLHSDDSLGCAWPSTAPSCSTRHQPAVSPALSIGPPKLRSALAGLPCSVSRPLNDA